MKNLPPEIIIIEDTLVAVSLMVRMDKLHTQIDQRPFPNGPIIMRMVGEMFPDMPQHHVYACTQHIKGYIASYYALDDISKQNAQAN